MKRAVIYTFLFFISIFYAHRELIAQKTDTIVHINGNVLTGDFKKMIYGVVSWKMDGMGTISMEEVKVNTIISKKKFEIKMKNELIYFGSFDSSTVDRKVNILVENTRNLVNIDDIVAVYPIKRNTWMRMTGNFSLGANYSKGSDIGTAVFSGNLDYRKRKTYFNLVWDNNVTYQGDTLNSTKADMSLAWQRLFQNNWSSQVSIGASQNSELGTKLRLDLTVIGIKDIVYSSWNRLYSGAGLSIARETPYDDSGQTSDLVGIIQLVWKVYKYTAPKLWVDSNIGFLPYITDAGRYRAVLNLNPKISIFSDDFKVGFKFYYNYDSQPPSDSSSKSDYGVNLELTYSFH